MEKTKERIGERRRAPRQKSLLRGIVSPNNRRAAAECLIRDVSPLGARLVFREPTAVADLLELFIPQKDETLRCRVIWRHGVEIGVGFEIASGGETGNALADRVARLEAEVATLKRMMTRLKLSIDGDADAA